MSGECDRSPYLVLPRNFAALPRTTISVYSFTPPLCLPYTTLHPPAMLYHTARCELTHMQAVLFERMRQLLAAVIQHLVNLHYGCQLAAIKAAQLAGPGRPIQATQCLPPGVEAPTPARPGMALLSASFHD